MELITLVRTAREHEIVLEYGDRGSYEEGTDMEGEPAVEAALQEHVICVLVDSLFVKIVVEVFHVLMVGYVVADCCVARLGYELLRNRILLGGSAAVDCLLHDFPAHVVVRQLAFEYRGGGREGGHYRGKWNKHVVKISGVADVLSLICDLET